jgi:hypothetical protein
VDGLDPSGHDELVEEAEVADIEIKNGLDQTIQATNILAKEEAAAKIVAGALAAATLLLASAVILDNKLKNNDGKRRRGRIGIQGNDLRKQSKRFAGAVQNLTNQMSSGTGGSTFSFSRDTLAWGWSRTWPVLKVEGTSALDAMVGQLGQNQVACRMTAIKKAKAVIGSSSLPQGYSKDFQGENYSYCDGSERVDIQVYEGTAFEK